MATVTGTFTATGNSSNLFITEDKDVTYQLTGGATALVGKPYKHLQAMPVPQQSPILTKRLFIDFDVVCTHRER